LRQSRESVAFSLCQLHQNRLSQSNCPFERW